MVKVIKTEYPEYSEEIKELEWQILKTRMHVATLQIKENMQSLDKISDTDQRDFCRKFACDFERLASLTRDMASRIMDHKKPTTLKPAWA